MSFKITLVFSRGFRWQGKWHLLQRPGTQFPTPTVPCLQPFRVSSSPKCPCPLHHRLGAPSCVHGDPCTARTHSLPAPRLPLLGPLCEHVSVRRPGTLGRVDWLRGPGCTWGMRCTWGGNRDTVLYCCPVQRCWDREGVSGSHLMMQIYTSLLQMLQSLGCPFSPEQSP